MHPIWCPNQGSAQFRDKGLVPERGVEGLQGFTTSDIVQRFHHPGYIRQITSMLSVDLVKRIDVINIIKEANNGQKGNFGLRAIASALGFSLGLSVIFLVLFSILRPRNNIVYAPKVKYADEKHAPPRLDNSPWAWLKPIANLREANMVDRIGLDAVVFLRFLRMCRNILLIYTLLGCAAIIPINVAGTRKITNNKPNDKINPLLQLTVARLFGNWLLPHIVFAYVFTAILIYFIWHNYRAVIRLRQKYFSSVEFQASLHARTLMFTDLSSQCRSDEALGSLAQSLKNSQEYSQAHIGRDVGKLPFLIEKHSDAVRKLEGYLAKYLRDPHKLPANRPLCKTKNGRTDAIDHYTDRVQMLETQVEEARGSIDKYKTKTYGFVSYRSIPSAHTVARANSGKSYLYMAPRPSGILWKNLEVRKATRGTNRFIGNIFFVALCLLWTVPNALIATFIANIYNLGAVWPWLMGQIYRYPTTWAIVQGIAAPIILTVFFLILPTLMRRLSAWQGDLTKSRRERNVLHKLYLFFFINNFVIFTLFSTVFDFVQQTVVESAANGKGINGFWDALRNSHFLQGAAAAIAQTSTFWIMYIAQRNLGCLLDLLQIVGLLIKWFKRRFLSPSPREMIEWTAPPDFDYANYYNMFLYNLTLCLTYSVIAPLILPFGLLFFFVAGFTYKYCLLYVHVTKSESGGGFWPFLVNRALFASAFSTLVLFAIVLVQDSIYRAVALTPIFAIILAFKIYAVRVLDPQFLYYIPSGIDESGNMPVIHSNDQKKDRLRSRFGHPALHQKLIIPMVHERSRHLLRDIYRGRLSDDPESTVQNHATTEKFEVVNERNLDFGDYMDRPEFAEEHGAGQIFSDTKSVHTAATFDNFLGNPSLPHPMYIAPSRTHSEASLRSYAEAHHPSDDTRSVYGGSDYEMHTYDPYGRAEHRDGTHYDARGLQSQDDLTNLLRPGVDRMERQRSYETEMPNRYDRQ